MCWELQQAWTEWPLGKDGQRSPRGSDCLVQGRAGFTLCTSPPQPWEAFRSGWLKGTILPVSSLWLGSLGPTQSLPFATHGSCGRRGSGMQGA